MHWCSENGEEQMLLEKKELVKEGRTDIFLLWGGASGEEAGAFGEGDIFDDFELVMAYR